MLIGKPALKLHSVPSKLVSLRATMSWAWGQGESLAIG